MINYAIAAAHFARAGKQFQQAAKHAERGIKSFDRAHDGFQSYARAVAALQAGQAAEQLRQKAAQGPMTEADLLNWSGPLPGNMKGDEKL